MSGPPTTDVGVAEGHVRIDVGRILELPARADSFINRACALELVVDIGTFIDDWIFAVRIATLNSSYLSCTKRRLVRMAAT